VEVYRWGRWWVPPMVVTVFCEVCEAVERIEGVARRLEERRGLGVEDDEEGRK
jgi:hypothetical protein